MIFQAIINGRVPARPARDAWLNRISLFTRKSGSEYAGIRQFFTVEEKHHAAVRGMGVFVPPDPELKETPGADQFAATSGFGGSLEREESEEKERNRHAATGQVVSDGLEEVSASLERMGRETSPIFVQLGRDLREVFQGAKAVTENVRQFAQRLNRESEENGSLVGVKQVMGNIAQSLHNDQHDIEQDLRLLDRLLTGLIQVRQMYELINGISTSFRVIRINIQIQCNANAISEELFLGLAEDITSLSQRLDRISKQITRDLFASEKNMNTLNRSVSENLLKLRAVSGQAESGIANAFGEIERLVQSAALMVEEAGETSRVMSRTVGEVVVSLQFHDSMSQRLAKIGQVIDQMRQLLRNGGEDGAAPGVGHFATAYVILTAQHRRLVGLVSEIGAVRESIQYSFETLEEEIRKLDSILELLRKNGGRRQDFHAQSAALRKDFSRLSDLFSLSKEIKETIHSSTVRTRDVADQLVQFSGEMKDINDDTKLQAVNTIIMAGSLGDKGRTIEVLAKEISLLADQTSLLTGDVTGLQDTILDLVARLGGVTAEKEDGAVYVADLEKELEQFCGVYTAIDTHVVEVSQQIGNTCGQIHEIRRSLGFMAGIEEELIAFVELIKQETDRLEPWKDEEIPLRSMSAWLKDQYASTTGDIARIEAFPDGAGNARGDHDPLSFVDDHRNSGRKEGTLEDSENIEFF